MPEMTPVGNTNTPPNAGQTINQFSQLLGYKQQQQQLKQQTASATIAQQEAKENQGIAQLLQDPVGNGIMDDKGQPTSDAQKIIMRVAPTTGSQHVDGIFKAAKSKLDFNSSVNNLNQSERGEVIGSLSGPLADPDSKPEDVSGVLDALLESKKGTPAEADFKRIADTYKHVLSKATENNGSKIETPGHERWRQGLIGINRSILPPESISGVGGVATPQPGSMDNGASIQPGAVNRVSGAFTPAGPVVNKAIPPGIATDTQGVPHPYGAGGAGLPPILGEGSSPQTPPGKLQPLIRPAPFAPKVDQDNYNTQISTAREAVSTARAVANDPMNGVQSTRFRNQQIIDLIPHATTGPGTRLLNVLASRLPGASGDAYQDLEHYTAQNSAALAKAMGVPGTNMGAETAAAAAGNVERNPGALAEITKTNDALNTAFDLYNRGLQKVSNNGNDPSRVNAYQQAFGQALDINAMRWADAHRRGDKEEQAAIAKKVGKDGMKRINQSLRVIKSLSDTGDLP